MTTDQQDTPDVVDAGWAEPTTDYDPSDPDILDLDPDDVTETTGPGRDLEVYDPNEDAIIDTEIDDTPAPSKPIPDSKQRDSDGTRPSGGNGQGAGGFSGGRKSWNPFRRRGSGGGGGGGGGGPTLALIGQVNLLSNNRGEANAVKASASGNTGASVGLPRGASGRAAARRAGRRGR